MKTKAILVRSQALGSSAIVVETRFHSLSFKRRKISLFTGAGMEWIDSDTGEWANKKFCLFLCKQNRRDKYLYMDQNHNGLIKQFSELPAQWFEGHLDA